MDSNQFLLKELPKVLEHKILKGSQKQREIIFMSTRRLYCFNCVIQSLEKNMLYSQILASSATICSLLLYYITFLEL